MRTYLDGNGYARRTADGRLVHRAIAYYILYIRNRSAYPHPFREYQVYHKDGDKTNNDPSNLELLTRFEHMYERHGSIDA